MHVVAFRLMAVAAFLFLFAMILGLGGCAKPEPQRNVWREWLDNMEKTP